MEASRLKSLRVKQIIFMNACMCIVIPAVGCLLLGLEPSSKDTYLVCAFLYGALLLLEIWGFFFPKHLLFMYGPRFMREIAEYEWRKLGKTQNRKERIVRLVAFAILLGNQVAAFHRNRNDAPMQFRDLPEFWTIVAIILFILTLVVNVALLYRIQKVDNTEPEQFRWFTLKTLALGVILGLVSTVLMSTGFAIVSN
ncbi:hypothetical protein [Paenibacillus sp. GCM10023250]|uniref:hypothetical protein n=1 Tax=Paenibacillus sp. GCM10023250 TaxID=3252648 RepID=UPI00361E4466